MNISVDARFQDVLSAECYDRVLNVFWFLEGDSVREYLEYYLQF